VLCSLVVRVVLWFLHNEEVLHLCQIIFLIIYYDIVICGTLFDVKVMLVVSP
jgi:hypothetical protein